MELATGAVVELGGFAVLGDAELEVLLEQYAEPESSASPSEGSLAFIQAKHVGPSLIIEGHRQVGSEERFARIHCFPVRI